MDTLISKTENFVINFLNSNLEKSFVYHNVSHTQRVVEKTGELIEVLDLSEIEKENLIIAAWFHDVGYTKVMDGHEKEGVKIAAKFLKENGLASERIDAISKMILSRNGSSACF
ncbi:HD domain-containing protein [Tenacibaculum aquimarinum]|uniref:HD domain-containing protein n=1 Tax=Tenacibaculum aquimarinum TaxID=2910675 RepID=UPI00286818FB|nr:HD domain-containing protein [Tenacibaculum aquimarinum]